jgi:hypothetical protein
MPVPPGTHGPKHPAPKVENTKPTPLDVLFILSAAVTLLLLLLWIMTSLLGLPLFTDLPPWLKDAVKEVWQKALVGSGTAGTAVATLALRNWIYKSRPAPNYLIWIPAFTAMLIAGLVAVKQLIPPPPKPPAPGPPMAHVPIRFTLEPIQTVQPAAESDNEVRLEVVSPPPPLWKKGGSQVIYLVPNGPNHNSYSQDFDVPTSEAANFDAEINHRSLTGHAVGLWHGYEYRICVRARPGHGFPPPGGVDLTDALIRLACVKDGTCPRTPDDPGFVLSCDEPVSYDLRLVPTVFAAERTDAQLHEAGWVVPSLDTLTRMSEQERPSYTRFEVTFTPQGPVGQADRYYYIAKINGQPVYIDGFLPERTMFPLQRGPNWITFALENLNFTGQYDGYEKLQLTVIFLQGDKVLYQQDLQRDYVALRSAPETVTESSVGSFRWSGSYVPQTRNKYEILLASADCGDPPRKDCIDRAIFAKSQFDRDRLKFSDHPVVMIVRPPLRKPAAYGLALGLVEPTAQVQFTFDADEAAELCHWAASHAGDGKAGKLIRPDLNRYEVETRGYKHCQ